MCVCSKRDDFVKPQHIFEPLKVSFSISVDKAPQVTEVQGFYYQTNTRIGAYVDELQKRS